MALPLSLSLVLAALKRHSPASRALEDDLSALVKELTSLARPIARVKDVIDLLMVELFPDTTVLLMPRWERLFSIPVRRGDDLETVRRPRLLGRIGRVDGNRLELLAKVLAPSLAVTDAQVQFIEVMRSQIDAALTLASGAMALAVPSAGPGLELGLGAMWPGFVDDQGVRVYIDASGYGPGTATLVSPKGTEWNFAPAADGWFETRTVFKGEPAAGRWVLRYFDTSGSKTLLEWRLFVSNDVDAVQIYHFFARRDPALPGVADLVEAQVVLTRTAMAHLGPTTGGERKGPYVCESTKMTFNSARALMDRDPIGS